MPDQVIFQERTTLPHHNNKGPFCRVELVDAAGDREETGSSQHISTTIPADILDRIELVGNPWNSSRNDGSILLAYKLRTVVEPCSELTSATRKIDRYIPMIIVQNLKDFGW
jgi:hypothetical protein